MITQMKRSHDNVLGFTVEGDVDRADYADVLVPAVRHAVEASGSVRVLVDMTAFRWEKVDTWGADLHFGHEFHRAITKMAIVGDAAWEKWMTKLAEPFYAQEAKYFTDSDAAWDWVDA